MNSRRVYTLLGLIIFSIFLLSVGLVDIDWMIVAPRFNPWYFTVDYWEFAPYLKMNWHIAYVYTIARVVGGASILSSTLTYIGLALAGKLQNA